MHDGLIDCIYEAAFTPELWEPVLNRLAGVSASAAGSFLVFHSPDRPPLYRTTERTAAALAAFTGSDAWRASRRSEAMFDPRNAFLTGLRFFYGSDYLEIGGDSVDAALAPLGLGAQLTTLIPLPTGEVATLTFERLIGDGRHRPEQIAALDGYWPHLARAGLLAARLGLERARATATALQALGLPAAVLSHGGRVRAGNALFEAMGALFLPTAFGGVALADPTANALFLQAVAAASGNAEPVVRSIAVKAADRRPLVVHVLPLRRTARDIFSTADVLVIATEIKPDGNLPSRGLLSALFDIAPAEARLAIALAAGKSLKAAAAEMGIEYSSARTYLARIFSKTGTSQQSELVALLKSTAAISEDEILLPRPDSP